MSEQRMSNEHRCRERAQNAPKLQAAVRLSGSRTCRNGESFHPIPASSSGRWATGGTCNEGESMTTTQPPIKHVVLASADSESYHSLRRRPMSRAERFELGRSLRDQVPRASLGD